MRIGHGYDAHRFCTGRPLILGGVEIPYELGLLGHSDADVLTHAICDAILGAAGLGDIGRQFPDSDPALKGINSLLLLERTIALAAEAGYVVENVDATILAEAPKIAPFVAAMRARLGHILKESGGAGAVNVKATTTEGMGFIGRTEGIAAHAVVLLVERALL